MSVWQLRVGGIPRIHLEKKMDGLKNHNKEGGLVHVPHIAQNGTMPLLPHMIITLRLIVTMTTMRDSPHHPVQDVIHHPPPLITVVTMGVLPLHHRSVLHGHHLFMSGNVNENSVNLSRLLNLLETDHLLLLVNSHHGHSGTESGHHHLGSRDLHILIIRLTWR